jgi:predicted dehydrogenase
MLLGEPTAAFAFGRIGAGGVDEVLGAVLRFEGGPVAVIDCGLVLARREEVEVVGDSGRIVVPTAFLPGGADAELHMFVDQNRTVLAVPGVDQYQVMVEHFAEAVRTGSPPRLPPGDAAANLRVIEALLRSLRSARAEEVGR